MVILVIPPKVTIKGDMLGAIGNLRYSDHDLTDLKKFPELAPHNYLHMGMNVRSLVITVEVQEWVTVLHQIWILNMMEIPHVGKSVEINICIKLLLSYIHGGFLWL
jgi:hypothetical protein